MKNALITALCLFCFGAMQAQQVKVKYYEYQKTNQKDYELSISDAVSKPEYLKFKVAITNKSTHSMLFNTEEMSIKIGDSIYKGGVKVLGMHIEVLEYIAPYATVFKTININGKKMMADSFSIIHPGLYYEQEGGRPIALKNFDVPGNSEIKDSLLYISMKTLKRSKKETYMKFYVKYAGPGYLKAEPGKVMVHVPKGTEHSPSTAKPMMFYMDKNTVEQGFSFYIKLPLTVANVESDKLNLIWNDMFSQIKTTDVPFQKLNVKIDIDKTILKNK